MGEVNVDHMLRQLGGFISNPLAGHSNLVFPLFTVPLIVAFEYNTFPIPTKLLLDGRKRNIRKIIINNYKVE